MAFTSRLTVLICLVSLAPVALAGGYGKLRKQLKKPIPMQLRYYNHVPAPLRKETELPTSFDWCDNNGTNYCVPMWNQHIPKYCGSCFLHGTLSMVADRLKIAKGGKAPDVMLGRQTFLNCAPSLGYSHGCNGGDVIDVVRYLAEHGLPDEGCYPYSATDYKDLGLKKHEKCSSIHACTNCMPDERDPTKDDCWAVKTPLIYKVHAYGNVGPLNYTAENELYMMSEIIHRGPITCSIATPDDFVWKYDGTVYEGGKTVPDDVDHDIEIVGWGELEGKKYWKIRNSWGQYWGMNGFAYIVRGSNNLQIEAGDCWYAEPTWEMEKDVDDGVLIGSMYGLKPGNKHRPPSTPSVSVKLMAAGRNKGNAKPQAVV